MAAIGGIFNMDGRECSANSLACMSRAMSARGGYGRGAYIKGDGGIFSGERDRMSIGHSPCTVSRKDKNITLVFDGDIFAEGEEASAPVHFFGESGGEFALECYQKYGSKMAEHFSGEFAIAVYDEDSAHVLLLRDPRGSRPLYFFREENSISFASEIKGIFSTVSAAPTVERGVLREHILSPCGVSMSRLYRGICEVPPGGGCVVSRLGVSPFLYCEERAYGKDTPRRQLVREGFVCPDREGLEKLLLEILYFFDCPQFDLLMPTFIRDMLYLKDRGLEYSGAVLDGTLCMNIDYSAVRRDRLSAMVGIYPRCLPPDRSIYREREAKRLEKIVISLLEDTDREAVRYILGDDFETCLSREKNTARRIRMGAMTVQAVFWVESRGIALV